MLNPKKQKGIIAAHLRAKVMERPYLRLCADVTEPHPFSYDEVRSVALLDNDGLASVLGPYEDALRPYVEGHFQRAGFPYSLVEVDGIKNSGRVNVALWLTKPDIDAVKPQDYGRVLSDLSIIEVFRKIDDWEEVKRKTTTPAEVGDAQQYSASMGRTDPLLFELVYLFGGEDTFREKASRIQHIPQSFIAFPPTVWHFYKGQPASEWVMELNRRIRGNPEYFSGKLSRFLKETE